MTITKCRNKVCLLYPALNEVRIQNSVLTAMTETASLPGFTYARAVTMSDKLPVGRNSPLLTGVTLKLVCAVPSHNLLPLIYCKRKMK